MIQFDDIYQLGGLTTKFDSKLARLAASLWVQKIGAI